MRANYDDWAEALLQEIYYCPEHQRVALIAEHLLKAHKRGYLDGAESGWIRSREECQHKPTRYSILIGENPLTCEKCGVFYDE